MILLCAVLGRSPLLIGDDALPETWDFISNTGNSATIILPTSVSPNVNGQPLNHGDYVGVFTPAGLCCGWSMWEEKNMAITAWGNDNQTNDIDGFQANEQIHYRVYQTASQQEFDEIDILSIHINRNFYNSLCKKILQTKNQNGRDNPEDASRSSGDENRQSRNENHDAQCR